MKILIADDDNDAAQMLDMILSPYGESTIVSDGIEAFKAFADAWESDDPYDLLCLDIMMPRMDGIEALKAVRKAEEEMGIGGSEGVKVLMITAREDDETVLGALRAGCEGYVFKTSGRKKIIEKLGELGLIARA